MERLGGHRPPGAAPVVALVLALLVATATVPASAFAGPTAGNADAATLVVPSALNDDTRDANTTRGRDVEVADLTFGTTGNVTNVTVDVAGGSNATGVTADDVDAVTVTAYNGSRVVERRTGAYDSLATTVNLTSTAALESDDVSRITVTAAVSATAGDGDVLDANVTVAAPDGSTTGPVDTDGNQTVAVDDRGFVRGLVTDDEGDPVANATVNLVDVDAGSSVASVTTTGTGRFGPVPVGPGTYRAQVERFGYRSFSTVRTVEAGETEAISVTIEKTLVVDQLRIGPASLGDPSTTADDRLLGDRTTLLADGRSDNKRTYVVIAENRSVDAGKTPIDESDFTVDVNLSFPAGGVGDFTDDGQIDKRIVVTTTQRGDVDGDGFVESYGSFVVTADDADAASMSRPIETETIRGTVVNAEGTTVVATGVDTSHAAGVSPKYVADWVRFDSQSSNGTSVVVDEAKLSRPGYLVVENVSDVIVGVSPLLDAGLYANYTIELDQRLDEDVVLMALIFHETGGTTFDRVRDRAVVNDLGTVRLTSDPAGGGDGDAGDGDGSDGDAGDETPGVSISPGGNVSADGPGEWAGDGRHQDVDGDGDVDVLDVQSLFADLIGDRDAVGNDVFDFNGDGSVTVSDVQRLFATL